MLDAGPAVPLASTASASSGGVRTMATMAMLMSVRIMKDTRKPVKDSMYSTTRAGTPSGGEVQCYQWRIQSGEKGGEVALFAYLSGGYLG